MKICHLALITACLLSTQASAKEKNYECTNPDGTVEFSVVKCSKGQTSKVLLVDDDVSSGESAGGAKVPVGSVRPASPISPVGSVSSKEVLGKCIAQTDSTPDGHGGGSQWPGVMSRSQCEVKCGEILVQVKKYDVWGYCRFGDSDFIWKHKYPHQEITKSSPQTAPTRTIPAPAAIPKEWQQRLASAAQQPKPDATQQPKSYTTQQLNSEAVAASSRKPSIEARLASCDLAIVRSAADELLRDSKTLREPLMLFHAASGERAAGNKEEAAFLYLAARLRTSRQILFEKGDRPQLLTVMTMTVGPLIMPVLVADPELARRIVRRVIDWDRSTPDPFRDQDAAKSGEISRKLVEIDAGLGRLVDQIQNDPAIVAKAREAEKQTEHQLKSSHAERCGPGTLDPVDAEAAIERIQKQAEGLARTHPFVLNHAGGAVKSVNVGASKQGASRLPTRLTVSVNPVTGKTFFAEVNAEATITPDRKLGPVNISLACVTDLWIGQRESSWKDVCLEDPKAIKPPKP